MSRNKQRTNVCHTRAVTDKVYIRVYNCKLLPNQSCDFQGNLNYGTLSRWLVTLCDIFG